ncbi:hypothetical protein ncot_11645 [Nocardioides sp. JQ2195]|uniref:hypothetical protein n=1 Tax=Nocardioides sp. JQ2195 TaxID=2592334 RepID=UPI00143EB76B|nr:hypothetical protein [Nocardioides sp. JQ2195]QIX27179.1 hypothetical protein ncot_11645 [Nocardioides sp. JQ2195]
MMLPLGLAMLLSLGMLPAHSLGTIVKSDFLAKRTVKASMNGVGEWRAYRGSFKTVGGKPRDCRSDEQMLDYDEARSKSYHGRESGLPRSVWSGAEIVILRYADADSARRAVRRNGSYPRRCPKVTEWVCTECDGIWTTWRTKVPAVTVGAQSVAWKFREVGNFKSNGHAVVARRGSTVVRVTVTRTRDVTMKDGWVYPQLVRKRVVTRLARKALNKST